MTHKLKNKFRYLLRRGLACRAANRLDASAQQCRRRAKAKRIGVRRAFAISTALWTFIALGASAGHADQQANLPTHEMVRGYKEIAARSDAMPQWERVRAALTFPSNNTSSWRKLLDAAASEHPLRQLVIVNAYFNRVPYRKDQQVYGQLDYWATPKEFVARNAGDCEDYALAKYAVLKTLGWSDGDLRIVGLRDHRDKIDHAVLAARYAGEWHLLDNRSGRLLRWEDVPHYQPVYGLNHAGMVIYLPNRDVRS